MKTAFSIAPRLALARLRGSRGGVILDLFAVIAFTVATVLALTVAGGTAMFVNWYLNGNPVMEANLGIDSNGAATLTQGYVFLAGIACAMVVVPILGLGGGAARLGARGRSERLASLRLIGMTGGEVVSISVIETLVQAVIGIALGTILWLATLPAWSLITFQSVHLSPREMMGPWWLWIAVWMVLIILAVLSTILGLRRVRISPLGVANRQSPPAIKSWRVVLFLVVAVGVVAFVGTLREASFAGMLMTIGVVAGSLVALMLVLNLVGPWMIQLIARFQTRTNSVPGLLSSRRLIDDPKSAWRNVSGLALIGFISAFGMLIPADTGDSKYVDASSATLVQDLRTGILITLGISFVVGAVSTLIAQAGFTVDRGEESRSLDRMGLPRKVFSAVRRRQVLTPFLVTITISVGLGLVLTQPFLLIMGEVSTWTLLAVVGVGALLMLVSAEACRPVQNAVLGQVKRRND